jgi:hypothetical protein
VHFTLFFLRNVPIIFLYALVGLNCLAVGDLDPTFSSGLEPSLILFFLLECLRTNLV